MHFVHFHLCISSSDVDKAGHNKLNQDLPEVSVIFDFRNQGKKNKGRREGNGYFKGNCCMRVLYSNGNFFL